MKSFFTFIAIAIFSLFLFSCNCKCKKAQTSKSEKTQSNETVKVAKVDQKVELKKEFNISGCDISDDMLKLCPADINVFKFDIISPSPKVLEENKNKWDVVLTRGVMLYFTKSKEHMEKAMRTMDTLTRKKILIWEWPEVSSFMKEISGNPKFEYHPIRHEEE